MAADPDDIQAFESCSLAEEPAGSPLHEVAESVGLRHVTDACPGITRRRRGSGFSYRYPSGRLVREAEERARIQAMAIPPAWSDVWICPDPSGHVQATGRDARGRKQYRYHRRWREVRDADKFARLASFGESLPAIRERTDSDLRSPLLKREKVVALVVRLLDETLIRIGNPEYLRDNESYGLTTMLDDHVEVSTTRVSFRFRGKAGKEQEVDLRSRRLARVVRRCRELPGQELFQYLDEHGEPRVVGSEDVNEYLREVTGEEFTSKDFRTWGATVEVSRVLHGMPEPESRREAEHQVVEAIAAAAELLGNTPAVARKSYVHPGVTEAYLEGRFCDDWDRAGGGEARRLRPAERVVLETLRGLERR